MSEAISAEVLISYSHKDERLRAELETHLAVLKRQGVISTWHDRKISAGAEWRSQIDRHINSANVILLLLSPDFLASDYCYDIEMKRALERHHADEARVIPVILRPCDWQNSPLSELQALPKDGWPVVRWRPRDSAFVDVAQGIRLAISKLHATKHETIGASDLSGTSDTARTTDPTPDASSIPPEQIRDVGFLTIDFRPLDKSLAITVEPYEKFSNVDDLLDELWLRYIRKTGIRAYKYSDIWAIRDAKTKVVLSPAGKQWAEKHGHSIDNRELKDVGIRPGSVIEVIRTSTDDHTDETFPL